MLLLGFLPAGVQAQSTPGGIPIPTAADYGDPSDEFGSGVSADGDWAVVAPQNNDGFYVYERSNGNWTRRQRIVPPTLGQLFLNTPQLKGNRLLITRPVDALAPVSGAGTVYVYERPSPGADFVLTATLRASDAIVGDRFGYGLAQSGDRLFIGASARQEGANATQGAVYVMRLVGGNWVQEAKLVQSDATGSDRFGWDLAFDGQDLLVSARSHVPASGRLGAIYVYRQVAGTWTAVQKLSHPGTPASASAAFGSALDAANGRLVASARGAAFVLERDGNGVWNHTAALSDLYANTAYTGVPQVYSVTLDADVIAMTAIGLDPQGIASPMTVLSYERIGGVWTRRSSINRIDGINGSALGNGDAPVVLGPGYLLAGAPSTSPNAAAFNQGAVQTFSRSGGTLTQGATLYHGSGNIPDYLGGRVAIDGDWALASGTGVDRPSGVDVGTVFVFRRDAGLWQFSGYIDRSPSDGTAYVIGLVGDTALIGHPAATGGPKIRVLARQPSNTWTLRCEYTTPAGMTSFDVLRAALSSTALFVPVRESGATRTRPMVFPFPATTCASGALLPTGPGTLSTYTEITASADLAVAVYQSSNTVPADQGFTVYERAGSTWTPVQNVPGTLAIGFSVDGFNTPRIDGQRLVVARFKPVSSLNRERTALLYERVAGQMVLQREITSSSGATLLFAQATGLRGDSVLLSGADGVNGALFVYDFSTGNLTQTLQPAGVDVEDSVPPTLAVDAINNRIMVGWPLFDRNGINNAGWVFTLETGAPGAPASTGTWSLSGIEAAPLPDAVARDSFETY